MIEHETPQAKEGLINIGARLGDPRAAVNPISPTGLPTMVDGGAD
jgi:hypothetical protein